MVSNATIVQCTIFWQTELSVIEARGVANFGTQCTMAYTNLHTV